VAWWTAYLHPDRFESVTALSVPWWVPLPTMEDFVKNYGEDFYINRFQEYGLAENLFNTENIEWLFRLMMVIPSNQKNEESRPNLSTWAAGLSLIKKFPSPIPFPTWFSENDLNEYVKTYKKNGFTGPLNYYRNWNRNIVLLEESVKERGYYIDIPSYFIGAQNDLAFLKTEKYVNSPYLRNYEGPVWLDSGHFVQIEKAQEVSELLLKFFKMVDEKNKEEL